MVAWGGGPYRAPGFVWDPGSPPCLTGPSSTADAIRDLTSVWDDGCRRTGALLQHVGDRISLSIEHGVESVSKLSLTLDESIQKLETVVSDVGVLTQAQTNDLSLRLDNFSKAFEVRLENLCVTLQTMQSQLVSAINALGNTICSCLSPGSAEDGGKQTVTQALASIRNAVAPVAMLRTELPAIRAALTPMEVRVIYPLYGNGSQVAVPFSQTRWYAYEAYGHSLIQGSVRSLH